MIIKLNEQQAAAVMSGTKIHHITDDKSPNWRPGVKLRFITDKPRQFSREFKADVCVSIQLIEVSWYYNKVKGYGIKVCIDGVCLQTKQKLLQLSMNEGFPSFIHFYNNHNWFGRNFSGKIIAWTDKIY